MKRGSSGKQPSKSERMSGVRTPTYPFLENVTDPEV